MVSRSVTATNTAEPISNRRIWQVGGIAAVSTAVANAVVWAIAQGILDVSDEFMPLETVFPAIISSLLGVGLGTVVFYLLNRFTSRPIQLYQIIGIVFLVFSLSGPLMQSSEPGGGTKEVVTLLLMHIIAGAITIGLLTTRTRST